MLLCRVKASCIKEKALKIPSELQSLLNSKSLTINITSMEKTSTVLGNRKQNYPVGDPFLVSLGTGLEE